MHFRNDADLSPSIYLCAPPHVLFRIMSKYILLLLLNLSLPATWAQDQAESIADIREKFSIISQAVKDSAYRKVETPIGCEVDPIEGTLSYYFDGEDLRYVSYSVAEGDHSWFQYTYYVWDDRLFFAFHERGYWQFDTGANVDGTLSETIDYLSEHRYYFADQQPIRCLEKKWEVKSVDTKQAKANEIPNTSIDCEMGRSVLMEFDTLYTYLDDKTIFDPCDGF